jgi:DNA-binding MarR family transcriptional regulator
MQLAFFSTDDESGSIPMRFDKNESAGYLINHLARLFAQALAREIAPLGLAPGQFMVLLELWDEDGLTQRGLVGRLDVEQATLANTLSRMERDGLIVRRPHPTDGRAQSIHLTERARMAEKPAKDAANSVNRTLLAGLPREERRVLLSAMRRIIDMARSRGEKV